MTKGGKSIRRADYASLFGTQEYERGVGLKVKVKCYLLDWMVFKVTSILSEKKISDILCIYQC